jgi:hypothetical protein
MAPGFILDYWLPRSVSIYREFSLAGIPSIICPTARSLARAPDAYTKTENLV